MEHRIAILGIIVEDPDAVPAINRLLHEYSDTVIGRMGLPCRQYGLSIISVVLDAPAAAISALAGKLGMLSGVKVKATYSDALRVPSPGSASPERK